MYNYIFNSKRIDFYLDKYPNSQIAQFIDLVIGKINYLKGDYENAIIRFNRVINNYYIENYKLQAYFYIAQTYEKRNDKKNAIETYFFLKQYYPDTNYGQDAAKRLEFLDSFK